MAFNGKGARLPWKSRKTLSNAQIITESPASPGTLTPVPVVARPSPPLSPKTTPRPVPSSEPAELSRATYIDPLCVAPPSDSVSLSSASDIESSYPLCEDPSEPRPGTHNGDFDAKGEVLSDIGSDQTLANGQANDGKSRPSRSGSEFDGISASRSSLATVGPDDDAAGAQPTIYHRLTDVDWGSVHPEREPGWKHWGLRFVPLRVPLVRRLQTTVVLFHSMSIVLLTAIFFFLCAIPLNWPILVPYLIHLSLSSAATDGKLSFRSERFRSLHIWKLFAGYFPIHLHKTHDLDPTRKYIFGYHPHGIISHGCWVSFATEALGFKEKFPGITNSVVTLDSNFRLPFYRDYLLTMGIRSVSKESIWNLLTKGGPRNDGEGRAVTIVIGGARESLEAQPKTMRLVLKDRKGFVKMAIRTGADLVPVLAFGENDLYDQLSPKAHPLVHKFQMFVLKVFRFTLPAVHGRGVLNYDLGLMPYRRPVQVVVGKPIRVQMSSHPKQQEIDRLHRLYVRELQTMWDAYKDEFAPDRTGELEIAS